MDNRSSLGDVLLNGEQALEFLEKNNQRQRLEQERQRIEDQLKDFEK